ncbi:hypothetical protein JCM17823_14890 [Halorubrum gandharaense]
MKRRQLLAGVVTGAVSTVAGCGYAPGGGDVRRTTQAGRSPFGPVSDVVTATPGAYLIRAVHAGGMLGDDETVVNVIGRDGELRWSHEHEGRSRGVAATMDGDRVHALTEAGRLETATPDANRTSPPREEFEGTPAWSVTLDESTLDGSTLPDEEEAAEEVVPIAADAAGAYVAVDGGIAAVRDGSVAWVVEMEGGESVTALLGQNAVPDGTGVVAVTSSQVVSVAPDGGRRWAVDDVSSPQVTPAGDRLFVRSEDGLIALDAGTGAVEWTVGLDASGPAPTVTDGRVAAVERGSIHVVDAVSGEPLWRASAGVSADPPVVVDESQAYGIDRNDAVAVGADAGGEGDDGDEGDGAGERWRRDLDDEVSGRPVAGWLDGETVAFAFDTGSFVWLQRRQADRGLL